LRAGKYNFTIEQGAQFRRVLTWKDAAGALVSMTGFTGRMKIKRRDTGDLIISLVNQASDTVTGILIGEAAGTITITNLDATTTTMNFTEGKYDLKLVDGGGIPYRLLEGGCPSARRSRTDGSQSRHC